MLCQICKSQRIASVCGKTSDLCHISVNGLEKHPNGYYVPDDMNIGGGDYIEFKYCLDCGQMQDQWPLVITNIEIHTQNPDLSEN